MVERQFPSDLFHLRLHLLLWWNLMTTLKIKGVFQDVIFQYLIGVMQIPGDSTK